MAETFNKFLLPFNFKKRKNLDAQDNLLQGQKCASADAGIDPTVECIHLEEDCVLTVHGYRRNKLYTAITWILIVISFGLFGLFCHWSKRLYLFTTHAKCSLIYATKVLIEEKMKDQHTIYHVKSINTLNYASVLESCESGEINGCNVETVKQLKNSGNFNFSIHVGGGLFKKVDTVRYFSCRKIRFIWDPDLSQFYRLNGLDNEVPTSYFHQEKGLSSLEQYLRRAVYGTNEILVPQRSLPVLFIVEILNPFFVFQLFSFAVWCLDDYFLYATAVMIMSLISITGAGLSAYFNQRDLHKRVCSSDVVHIIQNKEQVSVPTEQLVPGDILVLPKQGCVMYCDAVLLNGSCITNESALTGESDPVMKTPIPNSCRIYDTKEHGRHTLYCGTEILQTRFYGDEYVLALVIRTGFSTTKGAVIQTLLYPVPIDHKFEKHSYKFVEILAVIASIGFIYTLVSKSLRHRPVFDVALDALDLITIVVPPALPAAMTIGAVHALLRLKKSNIFCISPRSINVSGSVNCVCFDKTGTLTEEGLNMWGVIPIDKNTFSSPVISISSLDQDSELLHAMVTCHTLTIIREKICGDPMDLKIFESTGWLLEEPAINDDTKYDLIIPTIVKPVFAQECPSALEQLGKEIGIVRHFTFSSNLQRMTVIARVLGASNFNIYCKGAPESICNLCLPETVPENFHAILKSYTRKGYRVIATAYRPLPSNVNYTKMQRLSREDVEKDLILLGLVVLENKLKPETTPVISKLKNANLRVVIVTGDNLLTAVSVGRDCGIILPEQDVIAVQCVETPVPNIYYTYADVSPITSSISSPVYSKPNLDTVSTDETRLTELSPCGNPIKETVISFENATNLLWYKIFQALCARFSVIDIDRKVISNYCSATLKTHNSVSPKNYVFAMTGSSWAFLKQHFPDLIPVIGVKTTIFSRMNPEQKQQLVHEMQELGYVVAMCGDGANDCGALKAAHTGISLSNNESSAASPFTSKVQDIRCVLDIIKEGRASLVTSFTLFKFMALYSLTQFISVMILYSIDNTLSDCEFLYIDLFIIACCAFSLGHTPPCEGKLASKPPPSSLMSLPAIASLLCQATVVVVIQLTSFIMVQQYSWYSAHKYSEDGETIASYENYAVFTISALQYVILTIAFHRGPPYVGYIFNNYILISCLILIASCTVYLILNPAEEIQTFVELKLPPMHFRITIIILGLINLVLAVAIERFVCDYLFSTVLKRRFQRSKKWRKTYAKLEDEIMNRSNWPLITCDVDLVSYDSSEKRDNSCNKKTIDRGSETIPRRLPIKFVNNSLSGSLPNVDSENFNSSSDIKLNCVSSQTTIQSDYHTPTDTFSIIFTP